MTARDDAQYLTSHKHLWEKPLSRAIFAAIKAHAPDPLAFILDSLLSHWCGDGDGPMAAGIKEAAQLLHAATTDAKHPMSGRELLLLAAGMMRAGDGAGREQELSDEVARLTTENASLRAGGAAAPTSAAASKPAAPKKKIARQPAQRAPMLHSSSPPKDASSIFDYSNADPSRWRFHWSGSASR